MRRFSATLAGLVLVAVHGSALGQVPSMHPDGMRPGMAGTIGNAYSIEIIQVLDDRMLCRALYRVNGFPESTPSFFLTGVRTAGYSDGQRYRPSIYEVTGTETYTTLLGAERTVAVLRQMSQAEVDERWPKEEPVDENARPTVVAPEPRDPGQDSDEERDRRLRSYLAMAQGLVDRDPDRAAEYARQVIELAPESEYAAEAVEILARIEDE